MLVPVVVIATAAWRYREHLRQGYPLIVEKGKNEGIPALEAGEFDKAHQLLSAARSAVDSLGGDIQDADEIRQAADEAAIYVNLLPQDLGELLSEAGRAESADEWESRFKRLYKGRSIIVSSMITAVPDGSDSSKYELTLRILPPGESAKADGSPERRGELDLKGFKMLESSGLPKDSVVTFGAKLESFKYDKDSDTWFVRFVPDSGVFILHTKALDTLGWRSDSIPAAAGRRRTARDHRALGVRVPRFSWSSGDRRRGRFRKKKPLSGRAELAKRTDLVGKRVVLDDHVVYYLPRTGTDPDEWQLRRTNVVFLVPRKLRPKDGKPPAAIVRGVLRRDGTRLVCDVTELTAVAGDLERVENGVKNLGRKGFGNAEGGRDGRSSTEELQERGSLEAGAGAGSRGVPD